MEVSKAKQSPRDRLVILGANAMAGFLDFSVGTLIVGFLAILFEVPVSPMLVIFGGLLALLPDIDLIPTVLRGKSSKFFDHRQTIFHRPVVVIPVATFVGQMIGGEFWAWAAFLSVTWHFLHDTGWLDESHGISWLWPLSKSYWSWWGSYTVLSVMEHHTFLQKYWLRPTIHSVGEIGVGLLCFFFGLELAEVGTMVSVMVVVIVATGVACVWYLGKLLPNPQNTL